MGTTLNSPKKRKSTEYLAVAGGQAVENYDWMLYGLFAAWFAPQFFPSGHALTSTLTALAVFGVSFLARPLGAVLLGPMADRVGRKPMMLISISIMSIASLLIGFLPTAESIGWLAGALMVFLRLLQGFSIGVEQPLMASYVVELAPQGRTAWYAGMMQAATSAGNLLASSIAFGIGLTLGDAAMSEWGWRIGFWIGGALGLFVLWLRRGLPETLSKEAVPEAQRTTNEVWGGIRRHWLALTAIIFIVGGTQVIGYGWNTGIPSTAKAVFGESATLIFGITSLMTAIILVSSPFAGRIADHFGLGRTFVWTRLASIPAVFVLLLYTSPSATAFILVMLLGALIQPFALAFFNAVIATLMPAGSRVTGVGLGYSLGVAVFGGTASYILVWLSGMGVFWLFPLYIAALLAIGVLLYVLALRGTGLYQGSFGPLADRGTERRVVADETRAGEAPTANQ